MEEELNNPITSEFPINCVVVYQDATWVVLNTTVMQKNGETHVLIGRGVYYAIRLVVDPKELTLYQNPTNSPD